MTLGNLCKSAIVYAWKHLCSAFTSYQIAQCLARVRIRSRGPCSHVPEAVGPREGSPAGEEVVGVGDVDVLDAAVGCKNAKIVIYQSMV